MKTLTQLKAENLPVATAETIGIHITSETNLSAAEVATSKLNVYLQSFLPVDLDGKCVMCGAVQGGLTAQLMGTGFNFGMVNGEGTCGTCGYPGRAVHKVPGVGTIENLILQYHPSMLADQEPTAS
jgi:hypothetical protein